MRVIVAGSRSITDYSMVCKAIRDSGFEITELVSGGAKGVDALGEKWARENYVPLVTFDADWKDLDAPGAIIKENQYGKYNAKAGLDRNVEMADYADALIVLIKGGSRGSTHMLEQAKERGLKTCVVEV